MPWGVVHYYSFQFGKSDGSKVSNLETSFPIWKPAPRIDDPSLVLIQESNANLVDQMQFAKLPLNAASQLTPSVLSN